MTYNDELTALIRWQYICKDCKLPIVVPCQPVAPLQSEPAATGSARATRMPVGGDLCPKRLARNELQVLVSRTELM